MQKFTLKTPASVAHGAKDTWLLYDSLTELAAQVPDASSVDEGAWSGGTYAQVQRMARYGAPELVPISDRYLTMFEGLAVLAPKARVIDDVTGAFPNVPAFLAGHPLSMRRQQKEKTEQAPISIIVDTATSAAVPATLMEKRAAILLALVRVAAIVRPVELWAGVGTANSHGLNVWLFTRVETSPIDLTRAAFMLGHAGYTRGLAFNRAWRSDIGATGRWPYGRMPTQTMLQAIAEQAWPSSHVLAVPALHLNDPMMRNPEEWIREKLIALNVLKTE